MHDHNGSKVSCPLPINTSSKYIILVNSPKWNHTLKFEDNTLIPPKGRFYSYNYFWPLFWPWLDAEYEYSMYMKFDLDTNSARAVHLIHYEALIQDEGGEKNCSDGAFQSCLSASTLLLSWLGSLQWYSINYQMLNLMNHFIFFKRCH